MIAADLLVTGNAYNDGATKGGWFVARFIDAKLGLRCRLGKHDAFADAQGDFELKLHRHPAGDEEKKRFPYNKTATTFSMLVGSGHFEIYFSYQGQWRHITLNQDGDYALWAPDVGHRWRAVQASNIFTVRCPAVDVADQAETPDDQIPERLARGW